ncbi:MAG: HK97 family phage prohead protease [Methylovirgula sp.]|uniref:HK97 family phage prohead protease n=1 Tax=Methylovirgula sp. TaxID=1978224 RepID=UPI0030763ACF
MKNTKSYSPARVRSASFDESDNTIDIVWSTGSDVVRTDDFGDSFVERLLMGAGNVRLGRLNSGAPLLDTHSSDQLSNVIGSVVPGSAKIENGRGIATVKLSSARSDADTISKIREGVIKNISVGYLIHASTRIEGDKGQFDVTEVTDWEPLEVSAVPVPADPGARIRSANGSSKQPLSRRERRFRNGAAEATRLLQSTRTSAESRGTSEARRILAGKASSDQPVEAAALDATELARGARAARKLLRK